MCIGGRAGEAGGEEGGVLKGDLPKKQRYSSARAASMPSWIKESSEDIASTYKGGSVSVI